MEISTFDIETTLWSTVLFKLDHSVSITIEPEKDSV